MESFDMWEVHRGHVGGVESRSHVRQLENSGTEGKSTPHIWWEWPVNVLYISFPGCPNFHAIPIFLQSCSASYVCVFHGASFTWHSFQRERPLFEVYTILKKNCIKFQRWQRRHLFASWSPVLPGRLPTASSTRLDQCTLIFVCFLFSFYLM